MNVCTCKVVEDRRMKEKRKMGGLKMGSEKKVINIRGNWKQLSEFRNSDVTHLEVEAGEGDKGERWEVAKQIISDV